MQALNQFNLSKQLISLVFCCLLLVVLAHQIKFKQQLFILHNLKEKNNELAKLTKSANDLRGQLDIHSMEQLIIRSGAKIIAIKNLTNNVSEWTLAGNKDQLIKLFAQINKKNQWLGINKYTLKFNNTETVQELKFLGTLRKQNNWHALILSAKNNIYNVAKNNLIPNTPYKIIHIDFNKVLLMENARQENLIVILEQVYEV